MVSLCLVVCCVGTCFVMLVQCCVNFCVCCLVYRVLSGCCLGIYQVSGTRYLAM